LLSSECPNCLHHTILVDYGPHRPLHSFPTRRSSDLDGRRQRGRRRNGHRVVPVADHRASHQDQSHEHANEHQAPERPTSLSFLSDRKSTRLNSSHVSISYAVFCLKKKNITRPSPPTL